MSKLKNHIYFSKINNYFHLVALLIIGVGIIGIICFAYIFTLLDINGPSESFWLDSSEKTNLSLLFNDPFYQSQYKVGDNIDVLIVLDVPIRKISGVDVFLEYDPTYLKIEEKNKNQKTDALKYLDTKFSEFDIFPYFKIDEENGSIIFLAFMKPLKGFVGANSKVAEITFKALKKGNTEIKFKFKKNSSFDSNVAFYGKDILNSVKNLKFNIE